MAETRRTRGTARAVALSLIAGLGASLVVGTGGAAPVGATSTLPYALRESIDAGAAGGSGNGVPKTMVTDDVDGDGVADLVVLFAGGIASTFLSNGDGTFAAPVTSSAGSAPVAATSGHVDGDAHVDLVVAGANSVTVLLGHGDGTFTPSAIPTAGNPFGVALGDLDGDGDADLVATGAADTTSLSVYLGTGSGTFGTPTTLPVAALPRAVALTDLDGDGELDLTATSLVSLFGTTSTLTTRLGNGDGTFQAAVTQGLPHRASELSSGDADEDGELDVLTNGSGSDTAVRLLLGNGDGTYAAPTAIATDANGPVSAQLADLDLDGHLDIVATASASAWLVVRRGDGTGAFGPTAGWRTGDTPSVVRVGDFDDDGRPDLASLDTGSLLGRYRVTILDGIAGLRFRGNQMHPAAWSGTPKAVATGDVDGDGDTDVVAAYFNPKASVLRNGGDGVLAQTPTFATAAGVSSALLVDVDGDGDLDLVTASRANGSVAVQLGTGTGSFGAPSTIASVSSPRALAAGDLDGDGDTDLVAAASTLGQVAVLLGSGTGTFTAGASVTVGTGPYDVALGDLDGDGDLDLATANEVADTASVALGTGTGTFGTASSIAVGDRPRAVELADLDGDAALDLVVLNTLGDSFSTAIGSGSGTFAPRVDRAVGDEPTAMGVGDMDGDGDADVMVADQAGSAGSYTPSSASWFAGDGAGSFAARDAQPLWGLGLAPRLPLAVEVADLDGDGAGDLVAPSQSQTDITVVLSEPGIAGARPAWAPFASWGAGVDSLHRWMLDRAPTASERSLWTGRLAAGTHAYGDVVAALRGSADHVGIVDPVVRLYSAYFLRVPDRAGTEHWIAQRRAGATRFAVSAHFAASAEFQARYGALTDRQFVERIYLNVLGRPGEASGVDFWTGEITSGRWSRGRVMVGFADSAEYAAKQADRVDAAVALILLGGLNPTTAQVELLAASLAHGMPLSDLLTEVLRGPAVNARATA